MILPAMLIRNMQSTDWVQIKNIYESGIATGIATFETTSPDWHKWNKEHLVFGRLVAIISNEVVGWAALNRVSNRMAYSGVAEISIYISVNYRSKGIGKKLMPQIINESEVNGIWTLQAGIFTNNIASIKLHERVGFRIVGIREKIGELKGKWINNYLLERRSKIVGN